MDACAQGPSREIPYRAQLIGLGARASSPLDLLRLPLQLAQMAAQLRDCTAMLDARISQVLASARNSLRATRTISALNAVTIRYGPRVSCSSLK